ncbi:hypothetical protein NHX12_018980 [Muraenolepis orangiensis]|uniref:PQ-loop repeat-containing protein 3 n=1 Tax=Muraenolepis orangiensis TaxID=630683 RepID=A0A9Q0EY06_9TELE|nr:hypothetical protein NHX12_018980 [Muraenolepis orangiensis]
MASDKLLHIANFTTIFACMVVKFPQIFLLVRAKSTKGISFNSLFLELIGMLPPPASSTQLMYYDYPPPTYLEYPILMAQGWRLLTLQSWVVDLAMSLCLFISAGSKLAQLQCLWRTKDSDQVSALSWSLAIYTSLTRIYTTLVMTGDMQVLVRYVVMGLLNVWVLLTVLHYRRRATKKEQ